VLILCDILSVVWDFYSADFNGCMLHGCETCPVIKENELPLQQAEMKMVRWMCDIKVNDKSSK